jgi:hypothetical protein
MCLDRGSADTCDRVNGNTSHQQGSCHPWDELDSVALMEEAEAEAKAEAIY